MTSLDPPTVPLAAIGFAPGAPVSGSDTAPRRSWLSGDLARALGVALGWQLLLTVLGAVLERSLTPIGPWLPPQPLDLLTHTYRWDASWYAAVLHDGYVIAAQAPAFYPLFPALVWLVEQASFGLLRFAGAGLVVNIVATWFTVAALVKIARHFVRGRGGPWLVVAALLVSVPAFFMHVLYTEATFVCLGACAYLFALRRRWALMGLCLIPLTATRLPAVLFLALCLLEFCRAKGWRPRAIVSRPLLWFPAGALGFAGYALALRALTGNPWAMFAAYGTTQEWGKSFSPNIFATLGHEFAIDWDALTGRIPLDDLVLVDHLLPMAALLSLLAASVYVLVVLGSEGVPLGVFGLLSFVLYSANGTLTSAHRYVLPCLVIYLAVVLAAQRSRVLRGVSIVYFAGSAVLQGMLYLLFVLGAWAG
ncbi:MAG TPA: hypothetical protein VG756_17970 [Pseudonocardiaceae bacterium]|nr:hypothetical protein [Pseudonocardiaceae bacterium]